jgi:fatty-acid peroxygenase
LQTVHKTFLLFHTNMANIPSLGAFRSAFGLLREGFSFMHNRCLRFNSDLFEIRLPLGKVLCISGEEAASIFYDPKRFIRKGAIPIRVQKTLLGEGGVQTLDNGAHSHRKAMFMSLMTQESIRNLMDIIAQEWQNYIGKWEKMDQVVLFEQTQQIMCLAACKWAGIPLALEQVRQWAQAYTARVDAFGAIGARHWRGRWARRETEQWMMNILKDIRAGKLKVMEGTPAYVMAFHPDSNGQVMDLHMAAVELNNLIRPIVAIAWYVTFAALALHEHPQYRKQLQSGNEDEIEWFVQEVRRYYPFAPFVGARVRENFQWRGYNLQPGMLVLLDVYGTNRDSRQWQKPEVFWPERFKNWDKSPFNFIPQGGGDHHTGHRCAGERITIEATKLAVTILTTCLEYQVPKQDLRWRLSRIPTFPKSGFVIKNVRFITPVSSVTMLKTMPA